MKRYKAKQMISVMLLLGAFMAPTLSYADMEEVAAINSLRSSNEGNFSTINNSLQPLNDIKTNSQGILDFMNVHMKNDELIQALLNYEAAARMNEYQYNQELLFMAAPGSIWAVNAGAVVGKSKVGESALKLTNSALLNSIKGYSTSSDFTGPLVGGQSSSQLQMIPAGTPLTRDEVYTKYVSPFVQSGDTSGLTVINLGQFMQTPNLTKGKISPEQSEQMISLLLRPFASVDPTVANKLADAKSNPDSLTGAAKEAIVNSLVENAIVSVSMSALGDIVARRTPGADSSGPLNESVMEAMDNYSAQRFTNPAWYTQISTASDTALLRELAHMQAFSTWMQFQQFRVLEQQMVLLATMNSVTAKMGSAIDRLNIQLQQASAKAQEAAESAKAAASKCGSDQYPDADGNCVDIPKP